MAFHNRHQNKLVRKPIFLIAITLVIVSAITIFSVQAFSKISRDQALINASMQAASATEVEITTTATTIAEVTETAAPTTAATTTPTNQATTAATTKATTAATTKATTAKPTQKVLETTATSVVKIVATPTTQATTAIATTAATTVVTHPYEGKVWYAIGDSMTEQRLYPNLLIPMMLFKSCKIDGYGGRLMATMGDRVNAEVLADVELVTVFGGTNDYGKSTTLGSINDGSDVNSFYGHVQKVIDLIRRAKPGVKIAFMTPIKRGDYALDQPAYPDLNDLGITLEQYVQAIKDVCSKNSVQVIDLFNTSGIELSNLSKYTKDNLHPNEAGSQKIADAMQRALE